MSRQCIVKIIKWVKRRSVNIVKYNVIYIFFNNILFIFVIVLN